MPWSRAHSYQHFNISEEPVHLHLQDSPLLTWSWRNRVPLEHWYLSTKLHGVTPQSAIILLSTAAKTLHTIISCKVLKNLPSIVVSVVSIWRLSSNLRFLSSFSLRNTLSEENAAKKKKKLVHVWDIIKWIRFYICKWMNHLKSGLVNAHQGKRWANQFHKQKMLLTEIPQQQEERNIPHFVHKV